jgi:apolipoprotein D and lipocalin family protein
MPIAVDLPRYLGTWYQVALYPNKFQAQCARDTTASYRAMPDGSLEVTNACRMANGELTQAVGQARFAEPAAQPVPTGGASSAATEALRAAKLEVRFAPKWLAWLPWVWGDYWVIDVASDYRFAVVSEPKRQFLWVLSRSSALNEADEAHVRRFLQTQGFDLTRLQMHAHSAAAK